jgi:outer membrane protein OmpA-like peptidoglycan-associated protein
MRLESNARVSLCAGTVAAALVLPGCVATRDWVAEQNAELSARVAKTEARLAQTETQVGNLGGRVSGVENKVAGVEGKTDQALSALANLRLERRVVIDIRDGANFQFDSANLPSKTRKEINIALAELKKDPRLLDGATVVVAGHTDSMGEKDYNYDLGQRRANAVARYLATQGALDRVQVVPVSFGETAPLVQNSNAQGRAKNRRVEILVYRDQITTTPVTAGAAGAKTSSLQR